MSFVLLTNLFIFFFYSKLTGKTTAISLIMHILSNYLLKPFTKFDMKSDQAALKITKKVTEKHIYINFQKLNMKDIVLPITIILANHSFPASFDFDLI